MSSPRKNTAALTTFTHEESVVSDPRLIFALAVYTPLLWARERELSQSAPLPSLQLFHSHRWPPGSVVGLRLHSIMVTMGRYAFNISQRDDVPWLCNITETTG